MNMGVQFTEMMLQTRFARLFASNRIIQHLELDLKVFISFLIYSFLRYREMSGILIFQEIVIFIRCSCVASPENFGFTTFCHFVCEVRKSYNLSTLLQNNQIVMFDSMFSTFIFRIVERLEFHEFGIPGLYINPAKQYIGQGTQHIYLLFDPGNLKVFIQFLQNNIFAVGGVHSKHIHLRELPRKIERLFIPSFLSTHSTLY